MWIIFLIPNNDVDVVLSPYRTSPTWAIESAFIDIYFLLAHRIEGLGWSLSDFWACDILIPKTELETFLRSNQLTHRTICAFANEVGVAPGIVVGRLQYDRKIKYSDFNDLKEHYVIA